MANWFCSTVIQPLQDTFLHLLAASNSYLYMAVRDNHRPRNLYTKTKQAVSHFESLFLKLNLPGNLKTLNDMVLSILCYRSQFRKKISQEDSSSRTCIIALCNFVFLTILRQLGIPTKRTEVNYSSRHTIFLALISTCIKPHLDYTLLMAS